MTTNNAVNAPFPLSTTQGGTGLNAPTAHAILIGEGSSAVTPIVLTAGQVLIGTTASDPTGAALTAGSGVSITSASGSITVAATGGGFAWSTVSGTSQTMAASAGYFANNAGLVTFTLPTTAAVGDTFKVEGQGAGGWTLVYTTGQSVRLGNQTSTTTTGSWSSSNQYDGCTIVCMVANTTFKITTAVGNLTYV